MSCVVRKLFFCICENKDADQLRGKPLAILSGCAAQFMSDLVRNHEDRFSHNEAHMSRAVRKPAFCICENEIFTC